MRRKWDAVQKTRTNLICIYFYFMVAFVIRKFTFFLSVEELSFRLDVLLEVFCSYFPFFTGLGY